MEGFEIIKPLGSGGNSMVYLVKRKESGKLYTLKMCKNANGSEACLEQNNLSNEARILKRLEHKAVPRFYGSTGDGIVLEDMPGNSLEKVLLTNGVFKEKDVVRIAREVIKVLIYLHGLEESVIYRDLKPSNIVLRPDGHVSLIDFGAARFYEMGHKKDTLNLGTLGFAAPEQFGNLGQTDPRTDIYCFGMTLLQLLSGVDTRDSEAVANYQRNGIKGVSPELMNIIYKCTRPDREDRFKSAKEIEMALLKYPKKKLMRRAKGSVKLLVAAALLSVTISGVVVNKDAVISYAAYDMEARMPAVRQRLFSVKMWIEQKIQNEIEVSELGELGMLERREKER